MRALLKFLKKWWNDHFSHEKHPKHKGRGGDFD
jgi:hypothetical protein